MPAVLVVDDNLENCRPLVRLLRHMGHNAAWATSGEDALAFLGRERVKLVILDVMMPQMDGFDVLRAVRAEPRHDGLPVVMYSASSDAEDIARATRLGAQGYLVKGRTDYDLLQAAVEAHLGGRPS